MHNRTFSMLAGIAILLTLASGVHAQVTVYNNTTTFSGSAFSNGQATSVTTGTSVVADRLILAPGSGGMSISSFTFSVANLNATAVSANAQVRFWASNGTGGAPGTLLGGINFNPISFTASSVGLFTFTANNIFTVPANGEIWAGILFTSANGSLTTTQLNNLGQGIFNAPTVGSSADNFWRSTAPGSNFTNNPAGGLLFFGGNPVANFGWRFTASAPEPGSIALLALGGPGALGILRRRKSA